jgi:hypothetical protein
MLTALAVAQAFLVPSEKAQDLGAGQGVGDGGPVRVFTAYAEVVAVPLEHRMQKVASGGATPVWAFKRKKLEDMVAAIDEVVSVFLAVRMFKINSQVAIRIREGLDGNQFGIGYADPHSFRDINNPGQGTKVVPSKEIHSFLLFLSVFKDRASGGTVPMDVQVVLATPCRLRETLNIAGVHSLATTMLTISTSY